MRRLQYQGLCRPSLSPRLTLDAFSEHHQPRRPHDCVNQAGDEQGRRDGLQAAAGGRRGGMLGRVGGRRLQPQAPGRLLHKLRGRVVLSTTAAAPSSVHRLDSSPAGPRRRCAAAPTSVLPLAWASSFAPPPPRQAFPPHHAHAEWRVVPQVLHQRVHAHLAHKPAIDKRGEGAAAAAAAVIGAGSQGQDWQCLPAPARRLPDAALAYTWRARPGSLAPPPLDLHPTHAVMRTGTMASMF